MNRLRPADMVIVGAGWAGLLMAKEIATRTALSVVVLEQGPARKMTDYLTGMDELDYALRYRMMKNIADETITHRHSLRDIAAPVRQYGAFLPGTGTGGSGEHWGGIASRWLPSVFTLGSHLRERYGAAGIPENVSVQDFGLTYDDLEPCYWRAEQLLGVSGKAGNLRGVRMEGGNVFEGPRQNEYPTPPCKQNYLHLTFADAARELGYHPFPLPSATISQSYTNPDGISRGGCSYCGYCVRYGCMTGAKAQPTNVLMPLLARRKNFTLRNNSQARRVIHRNGKAEGVLYMDGQGREVMQPASMVVLGMFTPGNTRMLLLSQIGDRYDPETGKGTLGRNLTHAGGGGGAGVQLLFDQPLNGHMGSAGVGMYMADFDGDHGFQPEDGFLRGGLFGIGNVGGRPIASFGNVASSENVAGAAQRNWGSGWKKAAVAGYDRLAGVGGMLGEHLAYRQNYMDLDPSYFDKWGDPLLRMTLDYTDHERRQQAAGSKIALRLTQEIARLSGAKLVGGGAGTNGGRYSAVAYRSTHLQGGAIMGGSPDRSVVNTWLQHWKMPNLWVLGASAFPQNAGGHPTLTLLATTLRAADALIGRYTKHPGPLG